MLTIIGLLCALHDPVVVRCDLDGQAQCQVVVDREAGVYLGHVSTVLLDDRRTILAVYPKGHGRGEIVLKRSEDGGLTWSDRLPVPQSWASSKETPTLFKLNGDRIILFSGLYPIRAAVSDDAGRRWSELEPIGEFGGIVAMGGLARRTDGSLLAFFHDDGRYLKAGGKAGGTFSLYQIESRDQGRTWLPPRAIWTGSDVHLCEPGVVQSPDGSTWALLLRENRRVKGSHVMFSRDQGATWSPPRELPSVLTGDRHIATYAPDGRLVVTFRCMLNGDPWRGDWVAWVGRWEDLEGATDMHQAPAPSPKPATSGPTGTTYFVRLKDNLTDWDCGYAGLEVLPQGTLVATTYGTWVRGEEPFILSVRFSVSELAAPIARPSAVDKR